VLLVQAKHKKAGTVPAEKKAVVEKKKLTDVDDATRAARAKKQVWFFVLLLFSQFVLFCVLFSLVLFFFFFVLVKVIDPAVAEQIKVGRVLARITSRPGQVGTCDGYILEGAELQFYQKKISKKR
jgi:hypothetical protein